MLKPYMNPAKTLLALSALILATLNTNLYAAVGKVEFTTSGAYATNGGQQRSLTKGMEINQGDTIITEAGRTQIRFSDGGYISLQPNTEFKVDEYSYEGKTDGSEKGFFSLVKGGLRAITGAVGRVNKTAYRVNTPVATIGIRGTEFLAQFDGRLLVKVGDGAVYMTNASGDLILFKGQVGEVKDSNTKPNYTNDETTMNAGGPKGATPNQVNTENQQQQQQTNTFTVAEQYNEDGTSCVVTGTCPVVESASPTQQAEFQNQAYAAAGNILTSTRNPPSELPFTEAGLPVSAKLDGAGNIVGLSDGISNLTIKGTYFDQSVNGPIYMQRINNAEVSDGTITAKYGNLHLMFGAPTPESDIANLANLGFAEFNMLSATSPTNLNGDIGVLTNAVLGIDFSSMFVYSSLSGQIAGGAFSASGSGDIDSKGIFYTTDFETYDSSGFVAGANASYAGMTYTINQDIHGAVTFGRCDGCIPR